MSKLSNVLNMYMLLQGRKIIKVKELAEIIEVSPRMIKEYKNDLEKAGIYIKTKRGRNGGYYLENNLNLKGLGITNEELESLKMAREIINSGNHLFALKFETLSNKILNAQKDFEHVDYFGKEVLKPSEIIGKERGMWKLISRGIVNNRKLKIKYKSLAMNYEAATVKERIVHPYGTFEHDGAPYFFGYCELRKEIRYFKVARIEDIEVLQDRFARSIKYDIKEMLRKSFGIFDDDIFYIKLKISYPMSQLVKEKLYSLTQRITEIDQENIIFEANLKGYQEVKTWVLSMGSKVEVLEPEKLKTDINKEIRKMQKIYE